MVLAWAISLAVLGGACSLFEGDSGPDADSSAQLSLDALKAADYYDAELRQFFRFVNEEHIPAVQIPLERKYRFGTGIGTDFVAWGDLDGDHDEDAVVLLTMDIGASGSLPHLTVVLNEQGSPRFGTYSILRDRTVLTALSVVKGVVVAEAITHGPVDAMCCPSVTKTFRFELVNGQLVAR